MVPGSRVSGWTRVLHVWGVSPSPSQGPYPSSRRAHANGGSVAVRREAPFNESTGPSRRSRHCPVSSFTSRPIGEGRPVRSPRNSPPPGRTTGGGPSRVDLGHDRWTRGDETQLGRGRRSCPFLPPRLWGWCGEGKEETRPSCNFLSRPCKGPRPRNHLGGRRAEEPLLS